MRLAFAFSVVRSERLLQRQRGLLWILRPLRPLREIKTIAFLFCTQRARRAPSLSLCVSRWRWRGRKLRYDKRAQRVYPPPPPCGVLPLSQGEKVGDNVSSFTFSVYLVPTGRHFIDSCNYSPPLWRGKGEGLSSSLLYPVLIYLPVQRIACYA